MQPIISEYKQKILSVTIITVISFLGLQALSFILGQYYQPAIFQRVAIEIYLFHFFWLIFLFDLHFKDRGVLASLTPDQKGLRLIWLGFKQRVRHIFHWAYFRHYVNFLVLPALIYWSAIVLLALNPFLSELKQLVIISSTLSLAVAYWYFRETFSRNLELHALGIRILHLVKLFAAFISYTAAVGFTFYFGQGPVFLALITFGITFILIYQALFQHRLMGHKLFGQIILISLLMAGVSYLIFTFWNYQYLTAGLLMLGVYNFAWGLLHHHLDKNLSAKLVYEYTLLLVLILSLVLASHDFTPRIG